MILTIFRLIIWMVIIPFLMGLIPLRMLPQNRQTVAVTFITGYLFSFAVFEVIAIPCMIHIEYGSFHYACRIYGAAELLLAFAGLLQSIRCVREKIYRETPAAEVRRISGRTLRRKLEVIFPGECRLDAEDYLNPRRDVSLRKQRYSRESVAYWGIFVLIMLFQMYMAFTRASFDGDDAYYVTESLLAQQANVMNTILPYTGSSTSLDIRHALAVITMWAAFIAKAGGVHATIVSHTILPLLYIPMTYLVYIQIGRILFRKKHEMLPVFMVVISVIQMFGNTSIYTPETFFLTRTWQGKSLVSNLVIPLLFWLFLWISRNMSEKTEWKKLSAGQKLEQISPWILMGLVNMTSGICSSMGVILGTVLIGTYTIVMLIATRRFSVMLGAFCACIPNLVYVLIYLSIWI
ncbi:MAG: DUF6077 domain-containing protein [Butyrivibrio sp.]|nr:DUF6077 domain-containing protein [Butyrivibrio sp.]